MTILRELRKRISSVKSTQKMTKAMKMIAAAKLRKANISLEQSKVYYHEYSFSLSKIIYNSNISEISDIILFSGKKTIGKHLYILLGSDRGLCGGFNSNISRFFEKLAQERQEDYAVVCFHNKLYNVLKKKHKPKIIDINLGSFAKSIDYYEVKHIAEKIIHYINSGEFGSCSIIYNHFNSAISQVISEKFLVPFQQIEHVQESGSFESETSDRTFLLNNMLHNNLTSKIYHYLLENFTSEQAARMTSMDGATRNAEKMIKDLTIKYNRSRQANITKELIEIISGAEAL